MEVAIDSDAKPHAADDADRRQPRGFVNGRRGAQEEAKHHPADFGAADDDDKVGTEFLEETDEAESLRGIPDIEPEAKDARIVPQDTIGDLFMALLRLPAPYIDFWKGTRDEERLFGGIAIVS